MIQSSINIRVWRQLSAAEFTPSSCSVLPKQTKQGEECNLIQPNFGMSYTSQIKLDGKPLHKNKVILVWPLCCLLSSSLVHRRLWPFVCHKIHLKLCSFVAFLQRYIINWYRQRFERTTSSWSLR